MLAKINEIQSIPLVYLIFESNRRRFGGFTDPGITIYQIRGLSNLLINVKVAV